MGGKESEHQLLGRHFQSKEGHIVPRPDKFIFVQIVPLTEHVTGHAEGKGRFPDPGSGGQDDHLARFETGCHLIQFIEAGGNAAVVALAFDEAFDESDCLRCDFRCADDSFRFPPAADFENIPFGFVQNGLDLVGAFVCTDHDLGAGLLELTQKTFCPELGKDGCWR